jgi:hypothetical protein
VTYKSATQPFCLYCGKPIAKDTTYHRVGTLGVGFNWDRGPIVTLGELSTRVNEQIVSVKYTHEHETYEDMNPDDTYGKHYKRRVSGRRTVYSYSTWDGETYRDPFFCNGEHAQLFGYAAARHGLRLKKRTAA